MEAGGTPTQHLRMDLFPGDLDSSGEGSHQEDQDQLWIPNSRRLISGMLGLNLVLLGAAMLAGGALNREVLRQQEPKVFLLLLMVSSLVWMFWFLLWARKRPGTSPPHRDHHAGGVTVIFVLLFFSSFTLLLYVATIGYLITTRACKPAVAILSPFVEAPFLIMQTYLLWAHSKDCIHEHKIIIRSGLMVMLAADLLLWLNGVTEDSVHQEIQLERAAGLMMNLTETEESDGNSTFCGCSQTCGGFRKALELLYPFHLEFYLMAACLVYVMWKNVGRRMDPHQRHHGEQKLTVRVVYRGGIIYGPAFGALALIAGVVTFVLYQVWIGQRQRRFTAFAVFYGFHLAVMPVMSLCSLAGTVVHRMEPRAQEAGRNPTRSLDVLLLLAAALGQIGLAYFSLVAALAEGVHRDWAVLDLSYSVLSLLELSLQNVFIIQGLHRHPGKTRTRTRNETRNKDRRTESVPEVRKADGSLLENNTLEPSSGPKRKNIWTKRASQEICAFLVFCNVMLWLIPAFGVHPQFENGFGKRFFGFTSWFFLVNVSQPLSVFYRMHSVGALMELLLAA